MTDPYAAVRDILEASVSLKVAAARMEDLSRKNGLFPMDRADRFRALAFDLEETAQKLSDEIHTVGGMEP